MLPDGVCRVQRRLKKRHYFQLDIPDRYSNIAEEITEVLFLQKVNRASKDERGKNRPRQWTADAIVLRLITLGG